MMCIRKFPFLKTSFRLLWVAVRGVLAREHAYDNECEKNGDHTYLQALFVITHIGKHFSSSLQCRSRGELRTRKLHFKKCWREIFRRRTWFARTLRVDQIIPCLPFTFEFYLHIPSQVRVPDKIYTFRTEKRERKNSYICRVTEGGGGGGKAV